MRLVSYGSRPPPGGSRVAGARAHRCRRPRYCIILRSTLHATVVLALALPLSLITGVGSAAASDLPPGGSFVDDDGSVHEGYIEAIAARNITRGCDDDRFCPDRDVTRGEMAAFVSRVLRLPASTTDHFRDDDGHTFEAAINALADAGITYGCRDGSTYCPDDTVSRGEVAAFLRRAGDLPVPSGDRFVDDDGSEFEDAINALAAAGITSGCSADRFCPGDSTPRAQMATMLGRFMGLDPMIVPEPEIAPHDQSVDDSIRSWFPSNHGDAVRVARCESSLNPRAVNPNGFHGLFQIAKAYHRSAFERVTGVSWDEGIYNAYYNSQYARYLYDASGGWGPWSCKP